jgi:hypothetical protein
MTPELAAAWEKRASAGLGGVGSGGTQVEEVIPGLGGMEPEAISPLVVFLCTDEAANINGCTFVVAGGEIHLMNDPIIVKTIYKVGRWTIDELCARVPATLAAGLANPSPPQPPKE